jgi:hypothetical protein
MNGMKSMLPRAVLNMKQLRDEIKSKKPNARYFIISKSYKHHKDMYNQKKWLRQ